MRPRTLGRRLAFQFLFMKDLTGSNCESVSAFVLQHCDVEAARNFACDLVNSFETEANRIDELLQASTSNYNITRIAAAERNIIRLAISELIQGETPLSVVIDEAINLARKFCSKDSPRFVNGVLDAVAKTL